MSDLISRAAAIDALDEVSKHYTEKGREWHPHVDLMIYAIKELPSAQQWIPVTEGLPEEGKDVMVCDAYGFIYTAECEVISDDEWLDWQWYESVEYMSKDDVVAWMPLPEPWRGEKDET